MVQVGVLIDIRVSVHIHVLIDIHIAVHVYVGVVAYVGVVVDIGVWSGIEARAGPAPGVNVGIVIRPSAAPCAVMDDDRMGTPCKTGVISLITVAV